MGEIKELKGKGKRMHVFDVEENQCIWMKAGVVNFKLCGNAFDCLSCAFDKAMTKAVQKDSAEQGTWRQTLKEKPYNQKECRHMLTGRVQFRLCGNAYECSTCEFDQTLDEAIRQASPARPHTRTVSGFSMADDYYYHRGHGWARLEHGGLIRIGIDDFTYHLLGYMNELRLPKLGAHIQQTEIGWSVRREDKIARMLSPIDGIVVARNHKAMAEPNLAKDDPHGDGWLLLLEPKHLRQSLKNLLFADEATSWLTAEAHKLEAMVMAEHDIPLAATGGEIVDDIYGNARHLNWNELVQEFLLT